jgi:HNH endonuclease
LTLDGSRCAPPPAEAELARFFAKVVIDPRPGGCHHWVGAIGDDGYGRFQVRTAGSVRTVRPHLWVFELAHGLRPVRVRLLHSCDETGCVALGHLRVGTQAQNMAQMHRRGRGRRRHTSVVDLRGPTGRARAIRAALSDGWDEAAFSTAAAAGNPFSRQMILPAAEAAPGPSPTDMSQFRTAHPSARSGEDPCADRAPAPVGGQALWTNRYLSRPCNPHNW